MYKVNIEEFESTGWLHAFNDQFFYRTRNNIYKKKDSAWQPLCGFKNETEESYRAFFAENFWNVQTAEQGNNYSSIHISKDEESNYQLLDCKSLSGLLLFDRINKQYVGAGYYNKVEGFMLGNLQEKTPIKLIEGDFFNDILQYGEYFIVRGRSDDSALICFDHSLNELWRTPLAYSSSAMRGLPCHPEIYQDIVYLNMPENAYYQKTPTPMDIGAFCAKTGQPLWSETLPCCALNADLHGSEVYIASNQFLQIRDVTTGQVVWEMLPFWSEDETPCHLYPLNEQDLLVSFQFKNIALVLNRADNTIKQTITLPEKSHYCLSTTSLPIKISDNRWLCGGGYTHFTQNTRNSVVVTVDLDNSQPAVVEATIKPRPKHKLKGKTVENGEKEYFLEINHSDLEEVIRYGIIILQNFGHDKGTHMPPFKTDRKHNGKIHVSVIKKSLITDKTDEEVNEAVSAIKVITEHSLQSVDLKAGNGKDNFVIDIELI
jgi:hypothetical protein